MLLMKYITCCAAVLVRAERQRRAVEDEHRLIVAVLAERTDASHEDAHFRRHIRALGGDGHAGYLTDEAREQVAGVGFVDLFATHLGDGVTQLFRAFFDVVGVICTSFSF